MKDNDEVDLREYIQVIKSGKFLILAITLVAVISAGLFSSFQPDEYEVTTTLYVRKLPLRPLAYLPTGANLIEDYDRSFVKSSLSSEHLLRKTTASVELDNIEPFVSSPYPAEAASDWIKGHLKINIENEKGDKSGLIILQMKGELDPDVLKSILDSHIKLLIADYNSRLTEDLQSELQLVEEKNDLFLSQKAEIVKSLSEINFDNPQENELMITMYIALSSEVNEINNKLRALESYKKDLKFLLSPDYNNIKIISPPFESKLPVNTPRIVLNVVFASILGLFIGIFAAFIKNYLETS
jgi:uncharacterized protein involved in exopolysaccharide biosynthesis